MERYELIEKQLERFFEGETTGAEERELYDFFAGGDVPQHLRQYKDMFAWFDGGIAREMAGNEPDVHIPLRPGRRFRIWGTAAAAAAVVALILLIRPAVVREKFDPYAGSYIIRNGEVITDPKIVYPEIKASQALCEKEVREQQALIREQMLEMEMDALILEYQIQQEMLGIMGLFSESTLLTH